MINLNDIKSIGVIGSGTMGVGICQVALLSGYEVVVNDNSLEALQAATEKLEANLDRSIARGKITEDDKESCLRRFRTEENLDLLKADYFIEAVVEKLDVKHKIFQQIQSNNPNSFLATNTSSIPISQIGSELNNPELLIGMHFFNPAHIMKLVEIISGENTSTTTLSVTKELVSSFRKYGVHVKDSPGFIVNRVARHFYVESLKILEDKVADYDQIDQLLEASGFKLGPFRLMDLIGVDTNLMVTKTIYEQFDRAHKFKPSNTQQEMVDKGYNGKKSGIGFYNYS